MQGIHHYLSLKNLTPENINVSALYEFMLSGTAVTTYILPGQTVGVLLEYSSSEITDELIEVTSASVETIFGNDLKFDHLISGMTADRWVCINRLNCEGEVYSVVFVNDSGMVVTISNTGEVCWSCKGVKTSNGAKIKPKLTSVTPILQPV